jgi:HD-like signal output (HDOD) protein
MQVPAVPDILVELGSELSRENPDTGRISSLVAKDQATTGLVLKTINSSAYGIQQPVESISQAVVLLGLKQVHHLVIGAVARKQLQVRSPLGKQIWQDSLDAGEACLRIASMVHGVFPDEAYLVGLLHDCGALLMAEKWSEYVDAWHLRDTFPIGVTRAEQRRFGTHHAVVGYLFVSHWKLPERICQAIYGHHLPACAGIGDSSVRALIATLKLADALVAGTRLAGSSGSLERVQYIAGARDELMLDPDTVVELQQEANLASISSVPA